MSGSKKYKGRQCAYCGVTDATTADHIFAREFFLVEDRADLPQVPACSSCNDEKSRLEHYLTALLPFGARRGASRRNLVEMVPQRLVRNARLHRNLRDNWGKAWAKEGGAYVRTSTLPVDAEKVIDLFRRVVRGLVSFHWGTYLTGEDDVTVVAFTTAGEEYFDGLFALNVAARVRRDVGRGTFKYEGAQAADSPRITVWRIEAYGGLKFGDPSVPGEHASRIGALTGPLPRVREV